MRDSGNPRQWAFRTSHCPRIRYSTTNRPPSTACKRPTTRRDTRGWVIPVRQLPYNYAMLLLYLFLLFTVGPLCELILLLYVGSKIGPWWTVAIVLTTGIVGAALARWQGVRALLRVQRRLGRGQMPADELFDGVLILVAGLLLVTPGIMSDVLGFLLLLPPMRSVVKSMLRSWAKKNIRIRTTQTTSAAWTQPRRKPHRDEIIDVQVVETRVID